MARVLLINPPWYALLGISDSAIPNGLVSLAGASKAAGHEVAVFNADIFGDLYASDLDILQRQEEAKKRLQDRSAPIWQLVSQRIQEWKPNFVGVHVKTPSWRAGCRVAEIAKTVIPDVVTVAGGPHVCCLPQSLRADGPFDYAVFGEGERPLLQLLAAASASERDKITGVLSRERDATAPPLAAPLIENLDELPFDGREMVMDLEKHTLSGLGVIMTGRGCPFPCTYCASKKIWTRKPRFRSPGNVIEEIKYVNRKFKVTRFSFSDDTFTMSKDRVHRICELLRQTRLNLRWDCITRADCVDREMAAEMYAAGCRSAAIGIESGSPRILKLIKKSETREEIMAGCEALCEAGISFSAFVMIGFPSETEQEAWETLTFAKTLRADSLVGSIVTPYPGTELYEWALANGRLPKDEEWSQYYHQSDQMGLWDLPPDRARVVIREWFESIEAYNHRKSRLVKRFCNKLRDDPRGTLSRASSLVFGRFVSRKTK